MALKLNSPDNYEPIMVYLSRHTHPIAFENKVQCLMGAGMSREDAEKDVEHTFMMGIELEIYYQKDYGMFAVESEAVEGGATIISPYTGEECEPSDE